MNTEFPALYFFSFCLNRRKGLMVNISSGTACIPFPMYTLYAASKVREAQLRNTDTLHIRHTAHKAHPCNWPFKINMLTRLIYL